MHRALRIPEVVRLIVEPFHSHDRLTDKGSLASLARTSSVFHEPALDGLWKLQDTLMNLLRLMPDGLWDIVKDEQPGDVDMEPQQPEDDPHDLDEFHAGTGIFAYMKPTRALVPEDWLRFRQYSQRVRVLLTRDYVFNSKNDPRLHLVLRAIHDALGVGTLLLPRLEVLHWGHTHPFTPHLDMFLTPHLRRLHLDFCYSAALLERIATKLPGLKMLSIGSNYADKDGPFIQPRSKMVCGLTRAHSVSFDVLTPAAVAHLGGLPTLVHLQLSFHQLQSMSALRVVAHPLFSNLKSVGLNGDVGGCIEVVETWKDAPVEALELNPIDCSSQQILDSVYQSISTHCSPTSLAILTLSLTCQQLPLVDIHSSEPLRAFFVFRNLEALALTVSAALSISDKFLADAAKAWPKIEELSLVWDTMPPHQALQDIARPTLAGIVTFARACRSLHSLSLSIDAGSPHNAILSTPSSSDEPNQTLTSLFTLSPSPIDDPAAVAEYLNAAFPMLEDLQVLRPFHRLAAPITWQCTVAAYDEQWEMVRGLEGTQAPTEGDTDCDV
ncbi:hypothetical protein C8F01DRAFT_1346626 [Mycena amicta]|nr:hypothetical protein C8F01DRAFT_1346626 [Mycena amicta]